MATDNNTEIRFKYDKFPEISEHFLDLDHYIRFVDSKMDKYKYDDDGNKKNILTAEEFTTYFYDIEEKYKEHMNHSPIVIQLMNMSKPQEQRYLYILGRHTY